VPGIEQLLEHQRDLDAVGRRHRVQLKGVLAARQRGRARRPRKGAVQGVADAALVLMPRPHARRLVAHYDVHAVTALAALTLREKEPVSRRMRQLVPKTGPF
jgi:hypothetical protein